MDVVLDLLDTHVADAVWARILPLRLPASLESSHYAAALPTTTNFGNLSDWLKAAPPSSALSAASAADHDWILTSAWPRDDVRRQYITMCAFTMIGIHIMYFLIAGASYKWLFDHRMMQHPRFIKGQIRMEIKSSLVAFPWLTLMTVPWFVAEARGLSQCYDTVADSPVGGGLAGWAYMAFSVVLFLVSTDFLIYWVHRLEHHPRLYKHVHKPHHRWVIPTPWASHAFHPVDGYLQSLPYHIFVFTVPMHKYVHLGLFVLVNLWTIVIHDSDMIVDHPLEKVINGPAHHTLHHLYFTCNYGQYFTFCDRWGSSYRHPAKGDDPMLAVLAKQQKQDGAVKVDAKGLSEVARQQVELAKAIKDAEGSTHISERLGQKED